MPKSTKRFVLSDETENALGFAVMTDGVDLAQFQRNPIALWMHSRARGNSKSEVLPLGHWQDIEVKDGKITAIPYFDDKDEFAMQIYHKVEDGHIRMASAGLGNYELDLIEEDEYLLRTGRNPSVMVELSEGERRMMPILKKCKMIEASIVDIGSNDGALVLYDESDNMIQLNSKEDVLKLSANLIKSQNPQTVTKLTVLAAVLNLSAEANEDQIKSAIEGVIGERNAYKEEAETLKAKAKTDAINLMLDTAISEGRIVEAEKAGFAKLAAADIESVKSVIDARPKHVKVAEYLGAKESKDELATLSALSWDELDKQGKLSTVKLNYPALYIEKFETKFGKKPN